MSAHPPASGHAPGPDWELKALQVLQEEYLHALDDAGLPATAPLAARSYFMRYEQRSASLPESGVACRKGCHYCCHLRVSAPAHEVLALAEALQRLPDEALRARLMMRVKAQADEIAALDAATHYATPRRCALLGDDGTCSVYDHRPSNCRRYHSQAVEDCVSSFSEPANLNSRIRLSTPHLVMSMSQFLGFRKGLAERGVDTRSYELSTALREALEDSDACHRRMADGERVFTRAAVIDEPAAAG